MLIFIFTISSQLQKYQNFYSLKVYNIFYFWRNTQNKAERMKYDHISLDYSIKEFFKLTLQIPSFQNAIFFFSMTSEHDPKQFFGKLKSKQIKISEKSSLFFAQIQNQKQNERCCCFNINQQFIIGQKKNEQKYSQKMLLLLYLLKKAKKCKIIICVDKDAVSNNNANSITTSLNLIYNYFSTNQHKKLRQSIGISVKHNKQDQSKRKAFYSLIYDTLQIEANDIFKVNLDQMKDIVKIIKKQQKIFIDDSFDEKYSIQNAKSQFEEFLNKIKWFNSQKNVHKRLINQIRIIFQQLHYQKSGNKGLVNLYYSKNQQFKISIGQFVCKQINQTNKNNKNKKLLKQKVQNVNKIDQKDKYNLKNEIQRQKLSELLFKENNQNNAWMRLNKLLVFFLNLSERREKERHINSNEQRLQSYYLSFKKFVILLYKLGILTDLKPIENLLNYKDVYDTFDATQKDLQTLEYRIQPILIHQQPFEDDIQISYSKIFPIVLKKYLHHLQLEINQIVHNRSKDYSFQIQNVQRIMAYFSSPIFKQMQEKGVIPSRFQFKLTKALQILKKKQIESIQDHAVKINKIMDSQIFHSNQQYFLQIIGDSIAYLCKEDLIQSDQIYNNLAEQAIQCYQVSNTPTAIAKVLPFYQYYLMLDRILLFKDLQYYKTKNKAIVNYLQLLINLGNIQKVRQICYVLMIIDQTLFKRLLGQCIQKTSGQRYHKFLKRLGQLNDNRIEIEKMKINIIQLIKQI